MREEKRQAWRESIPYCMGVAGACVGGAIGIIGGPLGVAAGAAVGGGIGKKTGDLVNVFLP
jgi:hypothetical protein